MRISTVHTDRGFKPYWTKLGEGYTPHVTLDGKPVTKVITADAEEGLLIRAATDADRTAKGRKVKHGKRLTFHGEVVIDWRRDG